MKYQMSSLSLCVLLAAGATIGVAQANEPSTLAPTPARVVNAGHIYYNAATGERVVTVSGDSQTAPADTGNSVPVWQAIVQAPCSPGGYATSFFFGVDDPTGGTSLSTDIISLDYGDIQKDTVVDCIQINWIAAHPDEWANGSNSDDGVVGVEELAGQWMVWDAENGQAINSSTRLPVMEFTFFNLPGNTPDNASQGFVTGWTADVDLTVNGNFGTDMTFELGDSDGDCQSAAFCNNDVDTDGDGIGDGVSISNADRDFDGLPDSDLDGDGLFDWGWSVRFFQPGMGNDFDSDSDTGVLPGSDSDTIGINLALPEGTLIDNGDGTWGWDIDTSAQGAGLGAEDRFVIYLPDDVTGGMDYVTGANFGGFSCTGSPTGGYVPAGIFQIILYGPGEPVGCPADFTGDGQVNFFDITIYIQCFNSGGIDCDFDPDLNGDGALDFFDVSLLVQWAQQGCDGGVLP